MGLSLPILSQRRSSLPFSQFGRQRSANFSRRILMGRTAVNFGGTTVPQERLKWREWRVGRGEFAAVITREPAPEQGVMRLPRSPDRGLSPATEPVLAQIPTDAPGRVYWIAIRFLVWLASCAFLLFLYAGWTGDILQALQVPPLRVVLLIALVAGPLPHYYRLRRRLMAYFGAPARVV